MQYTGIFELKKKKKKKKKGIKKLTKFRFNTLDNKKKKKKRQHFESKLYFKFIQYIYCFVHFSHLFDNLTPSKSKHFLWIHFVVFQETEILFHLEDSIKMRMNSNLKVYLLNMTRIRTFQASCNKFRYIIPFFFFK